jgi:hypothetical protein
MGENHSPRILVQTRSLVLTILIEAIFRIFPFYLAWLVLFIHLFYPPIYYLSIYSA